MQAYSNHKFGIWMNAQFGSSVVCSYYIKRIRPCYECHKLHLVWPLDETMTDDALESLLFPNYYRENHAEKHQWNARNGWYRYDSRFALPIYDADGEIERYNIFHATMIIRHANDGKMYLYDVIDIKKETSTPLES